ncbi:hypothetical protein chiPu_0024208 [Chiloscyllium punctatum]|uniref:Uncharacterized protein n=1 Tax=Chiloscyllium punctatum TaxID=137246 RepID=A0A401TCY3_CHIPU|nr:hypothetical protein [Chiloscyllium punctatum]
MGRRGATQRRVGLHVYGQARSGTPGKQVRAEAFTRPREDPDCVFERSPYPELYAKGDQGPLYPPASLSNGVEEGERGSTPPSAHIGRAPPQAYQGMTGEMPAPWDSGSKKKTVAGPTGLRPVVFGGEE